MVRTYKTAEKRTKKPDLYDYVHCIEEENFEMENIVTQFTIDHPNMDKDTRVMCQQLFKKFIDQRSYVADMREDY